MCSAFQAELKPECNFAPLNGVGAEQLENGHSYMYISEVSSLCTLIDPRTSCCVAAWLLSKILAYLTGTMFHAMHIHTTVFCTKSLCNVCLCVSNRLVRFLHASGPTLANSTDFLSRASTEGDSSTAKTMVDGHKVVSWTKLKVKWLRSALSEPWRP